MGNKRSVSSGEVPLMFWICLPELAAGATVFCQALFSLPVVSKARTYSALPGLEMLFFEMRELQVLTGLVLGRHVLNRKGPEFISIPVLTMSPSLGLT